MDWFFLNIQNILSKNFNHFQQNCTMNDEYHNSEARICNSFAYFIHNLQTVSQHGGKFNQKQESGNKNYGRIKKKKEIILSKC